MNDRRDEDVAAYAIDAVDEQERRSIEAYLHAHPQAQTEVDELRAVAAGLGAGTESPPPASLRAAVLEAAARTPQSRTGTPQGADPQRRPDKALRAPVDLNARPSGRPRTWLVAAAAAVVIGGGALVWSPWSDPEPAPSVVAVERVMKAPDARTATIDMHGTPVHVTRSARLGHTVISSNQMPATPTGKVMQVWFIRSDGTAVSAGLLPTRAGKMSVLLQGDGTTAVAAAVSLEPAGGSAQPTTTPLGSVRLV